MEQFYTPMRSPMKSRRRRAISPSNSKIPSDSGSSSPHNVTGVEMSEEQMKSKISELNNTIGDLRTTIKCLEKDMRSELNESILIEANNRISANESRIFQNDIAFYEHEIRDIKENLRKAKDELSSEKSRRLTAEDNLRRRIIEIEELEHKLKSASDLTNRLQEKLVDKDQVITQLGSDVSAAKLEISTLEARLNKGRQDLEEAQMRNRTLSLEITTLKSALADCKEELRRNLDDVKDQKENMAKREIDLRRSLESNLVTHNISTSRSLINAFQCLSSQIATIQKTQLPIEVIPLTHIFVNLILL
ncbi:hypothetical protein KIN20_032179 [Parelaphostrongylus tenuis]|uniref:Uncharacterized protein n=1 Tax=Parelaphostrongylus tenuis TaxID=148309 RepID=A0AAD5R6P8_PARTN|nr:hypothetical protein KIN20_032179 [Parelaphostrongylus tenuis]